MTVQAAQKWPPRASSQPREGFSPSPAKARGRRAKPDWGLGTVSRFHYVGGAHSPDTMVRGGQTYRIVKDQLGSPRLVVNVADGTVAQQLEYDAFGVVTLDTNPGFQPFGFAGDLYDADTGLVRFGARDYDAQVGRWTAKDPIRWEGRQANFYVYVGNDPIDYIDPRGEFAVVGFAIGAGISLGVQLFANGGDFGKVDYSDVLISGAFGALSGGVGVGLKALDATRKVRIGLGVVAGAEVAVTRDIFKGAANEIQGDDVAVSGQSLLLSGAIGAATCGFGQS